MKLAHEGKFIENPGTQKVVQTGTPPQPPLLGFAGKSCCSNRTELGLISPQDKTPRAEKPPLLMHSTYLADSRITDKSAAMRQPAQMSHWEENHCGDLGIPVVSKDCVLWGQGREREASSAKEGETREQEVAKDTCRPRALCSCFSGWSLSPVCTTSWNSAENTFTVTEA